MCYGAPRKEDNMLNQVVLVGRLTKDPEVKELENGKKYTSIIVAVSRAYKNSNGLYDTDFVKCVLWNGIAANTCEYCHSGDVVGIKGRLQVSSYEAEDKETKYVTEVVAEKVTFLSSCKRNDN
jgi:single-strand DNA-binding protein